jgi:hypothetical protein
VWATTENNPVIHSFTESSGVSEYLFNKYATESPSELSVFLDYMDPLFSMIATQTNNYAQKQLLNDSGKKRSDNKWFDTTEDEIKAYFALCILMAPVRKPRIQLYRAKTVVLKRHFFPRQWVERDFS